MQTDELSVVQCQKLARKIVENGFTMPVVVKHHDWERVTKAIKLLAGGASMVNATLIVSRNDAVKAKELTILVMKQLIGLDEKEKKVGDNAVVGGEAAQGKGRGKSAKAARKPRTGFVRPTVDHGLSELLAELCLKKTVYTSLIQRLQRVLGKFPVANDKPLSAIENPELNDILAYIGAEPAGRGLLLGTWCRAYGFDNIQALTEIVEYIKNGTETDIARRFQADFPTKFREVPAGKGPAIGIIPRAKLPTAEHGLRDMLSDGLVRYTDVIADMKHQYGAFPTLNISAVGVSPYLQKANEFIAADPAGEDFTFGRWLKAYQFSPAGALAEIGAMIDGKATSPIALRFKKDFPAKFLEMEKAKIEKPAFKNASVTGFWEKHISTREAGGNDHQKKMVVLDILCLLDKEGDCPSVIKWGRHDYDNGYIAIGAYDALGKITLTEHSLRVAELVAQELAGQESVQHLFFDAMIVALGHDLGKLPSVFDNKVYTTSDHSFMARHVFDKFVNFKTLPDKQRLLCCIVEHHIPKGGDLVVELLRKCNIEARKIEINWETKQEVPQKKWADIIEEFSAQDILPGLDIRERAVHIEANVAQMPGIDKLAALPLADRTEVIRAFIDGNIPSDKRIAFRDDWFVHLPSAVALATSLADHVLDGCFGAIERSSKAVLDLNAKLQVALSGKEAAEKALKEKERELEAERQKLATTRENIQAEKEDLEKSRKAMFVRFVRHVDSRTANGKLLFVRPLLAMNDNHDENQQLADMGGKRIRLEILED